MVLIVGCALFSNYLRGLYLPTGAIIKSTRKINAVPFTFTWNEFCTSFDVLGI